MKENSFKKNDEIILTIDDISDDGSGIGRSDGFIFFVKNTLPGDRIKAKVMKVTKSYGFARCMEILESSCGRCKARCSVFEKCGGCSLQNYKYEEQLKYKFNKVKNDLIRIGGLTVEEAEEKMLPIVGMDDPYRYRNKAQYPVRMGKDGKPHAGFFAGHTHSVIETDDCLIEPEINSKLLDAVLNWMNKNHVKAFDEETGKGLIRHIYTRVGFFTHEVMVCLVVNGEKVPGSDELKDILVNVCEENGYRLACFCININKKKTNVILGNECKLLYGNLYITDTIGDISYRISPLSFYQVNPEQTKKLYDTAVEYAGLTGDEVVWDLYCGIGTISLYLSKKAKKVYGVEIVPEAIDDARINAEINNITNAEFYVGASEDVAPKLPKPDVIVVDPPRKGCDEKLLKTIIETAPKRLVYVSCDPATLARDLKILSENGFTLDRVRPADQFCHSCHVESCVLLERVSNRKADSYVKLNVKMADYYRIKDLKGGEADG